MTLQRSITANIDIDIAKTGHCRVDVPKAVSVDEVGDAIQSELENLDFEVDDPDYKTVLDPISKEASDEQRKRTVCDVWTKWG